MSTCLKIVNPDVGAALRWCIKSEHTSVMLTGYRFENGVRVADYSHSQLFNKCISFTKAGDTKYQLKVYATFHGSSPKPVTVTLDVDGSEVRQCELTRDGYDASTIAVR